MAVRIAALVVFAAVLMLPAAAVRAQAPVVGDPVKGKVVFEQCAACHALDDAKSAGPSLKGMFGRKAGSRDDFRYSVAMTRSGIVWDAATLDAYLADPLAYIKGNRMSFAGVTGKTERDDLISFLEQVTQTEPGPTR